VRAGEDGKPDDIHVFLQGGIDDHLRRLAQAGVDDLHARIPQGAGNHFGAPIMPVKAGLGNKDADFSVCGHA